MVSINFIGAFVASVVLSVSAQNEAAGPLASVTASVVEAAKAWVFAPVTSIQARVQGDTPVWDATNKIFVSAYGASFAERYRGVLDTVNMAAVEGALKYPQAECINKDVVVNCQRKNKITNVVFYKTTIVQPRPAMAYYQNDTSGRAAIEHCPFIPMDGGQCTPTNGVLPDTCKQFLGLDGLPKLGMCIGGQLQDKEPIAPYPNNYWFSYPNSCPTKLWADKSDACRAEQFGGVCPLGKTPDGLTCQFSYEILGYVKLDDVVGITSMVNPTTNKTFVDYSEFCNAGGVEFDASVTNGVVSVKETIPFWADPGNPDANTARVQKLVDAYTKVVTANPKTADGGVMKPLPAIATLSSTNPPCWRNNVRCALAKFGCRRSYFSQICEPCTAKGAGCQVTPSNYIFPVL